MKTTAGGLAVLDQSVHDSLHQSESTLAGLLSPTQHRFDNGQPWSNYSYVTYVTEIRGAAIAEGPRDVGMPIEILYIDAQM